MIQIRALGSQNDILFSLLAIVLLAAFGVLVPTISRRISRAGTLSVALVLAVSVVTLCPRQGWSRLFNSGIYSLPAVEGCLAPRNWLNLHGWFGPYGITSTQGYLNILLFIPVALALAAFLGKPIMAFFLLSLFSIAIEAWQAFSGTRTCAGVDWAANTFGVFIGVSIGVLMLATARRDSSGEQRV